MVSPTIPPEHIAILGGGIIGLTSAYYLLTSPLLPPLSTITLLENSHHGIAQGASSYAAGFLAGGTGDAWQGPPSRPLARLSWRCHLELERVLGGRERYGFRECRAVGVRVGEGEERRSVYRELPKGEKVEESSWVEGEKEDLTGEGGVGQLDPAQFCRVLHAHLSTLGLHTTFATPLSLSPLPTTPRLLTYLPHSSPHPITLPFTKLLITAGPWSSTLCATLNLPPIALTNLPGHSILIRPSPSPSPLPAEAIFAGISGAEVGVHASTSGVARGLNEEEIKGGFTRSPEMFARGNGVVYVAGENSIPSGFGDGAEGEGGLRKNKLPKTVDGVKGLLDEGLVRRLIVAAGLVSKRLDVGRGAMVEKTQFCYRPISEDGEPIIDELEKGVFVATGHGPWGITLAPGTGKVISEMILGNPTQPLSADISGLRLSRFQKSKS